MIFVRKIICLATKIFGSTKFNHIPAEFVISCESIVDTLVVLPFTLLLELMDNVVFLVSWLLPVTVPVSSSLLYIAVKNGKEVHRVLDEFLILLCSICKKCPHVQWTMPYWVNILCTAFWVPCRVIRTDRCSQMHDHLFLFLRIK